MSALSIAGRDYDVDAWRLADVEGGGHVLELGLGWSYMIYAFAVWDRNPTQWVLIQTDCAVAHVDEEILTRGQPFACAPLVLPVPQDGPPLTLLDGPRPGSLRVQGARFEAQGAPFAWELRLGLEDCGRGSEPLELCFGAGDGQLSGWRLHGSAGEALAHDVDFACGFRVWGAGAKARWAKDPAAPSRG